jgi:hypothetical protein
MWKYTTDLLLIAICENVWQTIQRESNARQTILRGEISDAVNFEKFQTVTVRLTKEKSICHRQKGVDCESFLPKPCDDARENCFASE